MDPEQPSPPFKETKSTELDIFTRDVSTELRHGLAATMTKMREGTQQFGEYSTTVQGVEIQLHNTDNTNAPGRTPESIVATIHAGQTTREVHGRVRVTAHTEPPINLSAYDAAPVYPDSVIITGLSETRLVNLPDGIQIRAGFEIGADHISRPQPLEIVLPLPETEVPVIDGEPIEITIDWDDSELDVNPNAVVLTKTTDQHGGTVWSKTYVDQKVDNRGQRGEIRYPRYDGYDGGSYRVMNLPVDQVEQHHAEAILSQAPNVETAPVFDNIVGVDIPRSIT